MDSFAGPVELIVGAVIGVDVVIGSGVGVGFAVTVDGTDDVVGTVGGAGAAAAAAAGTGALALTRFGLNAVLFRSMIGDYQPGGSRTKLVRKPAWHRMMVNSKSHSLLGLKHFAIFAPGSWIDS